MRLVILCLLVGCARDVAAVFPASPDVPTGTLVLLLSRPAAHVTVAINGQLIVRDRRTAQITIAKVPTGTVEIALTANGGDRQLRVWLDDTHPTTVPLGVAEPARGFLETLFGTLVTLVAYSLLH